MDNIDVHLEIGLLKAEIRNLSSDVKEIKEEQKQFVQFMHQIKGGKSWLFAMITVAGIMGALLNNILGVVFHKG